MYWDDVFDPILLADDIQESESLQSTVERNDSTAFLRELYRYTAEPASEIKDRLPAH